MARVLSNETSLSRQQKRMHRESRVLKNLLLVEAGAAVLFVLIGAAAWFLGHGTTMIWVGVVLGFFSYAHFLQTRQNKQNEKYMAAGLRGESEVAKILAENLDNSYYLYNDISIRNGFNRAQIDHMVVCGKGIFVLETKNWRGRLTGSETERKWLQHVYSDRPPRVLSNPVLQNKRHVTVLEKFLRSGGVPEVPIISMLVFTGRNTTLDIKDQQTLMLWPRETADYILRYRGEKELSESAVDAVLNRMQRCV